ncbi:MAG: SEC-C metal-binding domain-containing protein [Vicinamibacterales bacterium]
MVGATKAGRNDPCLCGSGKKYKRCCAAQAEALDLTWHRLRRAEGNVVEQVLAYTGEHYGPDIVRRAWEEFAFGAERPDPDDLLFANAFVPWFVFSWIPDAVAPAALAAVPLRPPLALEYAALHGEALDDFTHRFACEMCRRPSSFYVVDAAEPGRSLTLRDVMTQRAYRVLERSASTSLRRGLVLYTRVLELDGVAIMCGCAPLAIPAQQHVPLLDLRRALTGNSKPMSETQLQVYGEELREHYFSLQDELANPRLPELRNTDRDPLRLQTLHFELRCTPREAFDRLQPLAAGHTPEECLAEARFDGTGALRAVRFDWLKSGNAIHTQWENTILGGLRVNGTHLTAHVNSDRRAERIRAEIEQRLGGDAVYARTVFESIEKALAQRRSRPETARERRARNANERLNALPEVQAKLREMASAHWAQWLDEKIPALGNRTPRQSARTRAGRERLEALLQSFEAAPSDTPDPFRPDVATLRQELRLIP